MTTKTWPDGIVVETESGYFLIKGNYRYRVPTQRVLDSWSFPLIVKTSDAAVAAYKVFAKIGFRDGSLIHNITDGKMYLISNNKRRQFTNPDLLTDYGVKFKDFIYVSDYETKLQEVGEPLG